MISCSLASAALALAPLPAITQREPGGWFHWRGPAQNGTSPQVDLPSTLSLATPGSWRVTLPGRGTPVIAGDRVYAMAYAGSGDTLHEVLVCLAARDGARLWQQRFPDFLNDVSYERYAIGSPCVDPHTGRVVCLSSAGLLTCLTSGGELCWQHCLLGTLGRMTFPNGRTGSPLIDSGNVIVHAVTAGWGEQGSASDRFYAFDLATGAMVWHSTPGGRPVDNSFSSPVVAVEDGRRVLYAGLGDGSLACLDARTGDPIWRRALSLGGVNASALLYGNTVIAVHGKENIDASSTGRMVALARASGAGRQRGDEVWRNDLSSFTSSPVLVGDRVFLTEAAGSLACVDAATGAVRWLVKLGPDQLHASPAWADGRLYVPMHNGKLFVLRPTDQGVAHEQVLQLDGECLGAPAIGNGRVYVHSTAALYCFAGGKAPAPRAPDDTDRQNARDDDTPGAAPAVRLQVVPADHVALAGERVTFTLRTLDAIGRTLAADARATWENLPPGVTADGNCLAIAADTAPLAAVLTAKSGDLSATTRLRVAPRTPFAVTFAGDAPLPAPPPAWWIGAVGKWEVCELDGERVLARKLDVPLFQRTQSLLGHPDATNYNMQVDVRSDGNARIMGSVGVIHQRYAIVLKGNHQELEIASSLEVFRRNTPLPWRPGVWYRLRTRVDIAPDGAGVIRAKAWPRAAAEPDAWTLEVRDPQAHRHGAPGIYGFTPQNRFRVYIANLMVRAND
jgi:outer membrane protein assembly factor BamB